MYDPLKYPCIKLHFMFILYYPMHKAKCKDYDSSIDSSRKRVL